MRIRWLALSAVMVCATVTCAVAGEPAHRVGKGDTLWDLSGRFWNNPAEWPELWSRNPHIRNPHWIYPGDPIFLERPGPEVTGPGGAPHRLPLERLTPEGPEADARDEADAAKRAVATAAPGPRGEGLFAAGRLIRLARNQAQDFISSHRLPRLGSVENRSLAKTAWGAGEDVEITVDGEVELRPGDRITLFDDRAPVSHPITGEPQGYYVRVLGHAELRSGPGRTVIARLAETYDAVEDGAGITAYAEPTREVELRVAQAEVEGVILRGGPEETLFGADQVVFLDRGSLHRVEPGVVVEIPARARRHAAQGLVDLIEPLARVVVVSVQDKTSTALIVESRFALEAGDRFVAAPLRP